MFSRGASLPASDGRRRFLWLTDGPPGLPGRPHELLNESSAALYLKLRPPNLAALMAEVVQTIPRTCLTSIAPPRAANVAYICKYLCDAYLQVTSDKNGVWRAKAILRYINVRVCINANGSCVSWAQERLL